MSTNQNSDDALNNALKTELDNLESRIGRLDRLIDRMVVRLEKLQIERKRSDSLREHANALLNRNDRLSAERQAAQDWQSSPGPVDNRFVHLTRTTEQDSENLAEYVTSSSSEPAPGDMLVSAMASPDAESEQGRPSAGRGKGDNIAAAVFNILKSREDLAPDDRPLHYRALVPEIEGLGIYVSGRDPGLNLIAHIHKDDRFTRPKRGYYGLAEWYPQSSRNVGEHSARRSGRGRAGS